LVVNLAALLRQALNTLLLRVVVAVDSMWAVVAALAGSALEHLRLQQELHIQLPLGLAARRKTRPGPAIMVQTPRRFLFPLLAAEVARTLINPAGQVVPVAEAQPIRVEH
jgi:hypothetical protein